MVLRHEQTAQLAANFLAAVGVGVLVWKYKRREVIIDGVIGIFLDRRQISLLLGHAGGGIGCIALLVIADGLVNIARIPVKSGELCVSRGNSLSPLLRDTLAVTRNCSPITLSFRDLDQSRGVVNGKGSACLVVLAYQCIDKQVQQLRIVR